MPYPIFDVPVFGGALLIAGIAIFHVLIAHGAVGGGIVAAVAHTVAIRRGDETLLRFLRRVSHVFILGPLIAGAVSGAGIWFAISVVSPETTGLLIHQFVWAWATEWVAFAVEIAAAYVYYYGWRIGLAPRTHAAVAWVYAASAVASLLIINHIISFMITPGRWPDTRDFWDAWLNPSSWPSDLLRLVSALSLGAIFTIVVAAFGRGPREEKQRLMNFAALFLLPLGLMVPLGAWFFHAAPAPARGVVLGGAIVPTLFFTFGLIASTLVGAYAYWALIREKRYVSPETALLLAAIAFVATGAGEFVREGMRKPYLVWGEVWSNGLRPADRARIDREGVLVAVPFAVPAGADLARVPVAERGRWVFEAQCLRCHTIDGANGIEPLVRGWSRELLRVTTARLDEMKAFMPPFVGTEGEREALVEFLHEIGNPPRAAGTKGARDVRGPVESGR